MHRGQQRNQQRRLCKLTANVSWTHEALPKQRRPCPFIYIYYYVFSLDVIVHVSLCMQEALVCLLNPHRFKHQPFKPYRLRPPPERWTPPVGDPAVLWWLGVRGTCCFVDGLSDKDKSGDGSYERIGVFRTCSVWVFLIVWSRYHVLPGLCVALDDRFLWDHV